MNKKTDIIICGLVRNQTKLVDKIDMYYQWRQEGFVDQIIYSTWIGEVDQYSGLREFLKKKDVKLIEIREPKLILKGGHQLHQMIAFHYGLSMIEDDDKYVLKTRVDLAEISPHMPDFFKSGMEISNDFANVGIKNKILIEYAQMMYPFLCADAQFFGRKGDLKKLVNMSNEMELIYSRLAVEQTFFFQPFSKIKLFREHFYWGLPHISEIAKNRDDQVKFVSESHYIKDVLKAWWMVLDNYFQIGWGTIEETHFPNTIQECFEYNGSFNSMNQNLNNDQEFTTQWDSSNEARAKMVGEYDKSDVIVLSIFAKHLVSLIDQEEQKEIRALCAAREHSNPFNIEIKKYEEYEKYRQLFSDLPAPRATLSNASQYVIDGCVQHMFVKDHNDTASSRYHAQITHLRRENDMLRRELNLQIGHTKIHQILNRMLSNQTKEFIKYKLPWVADFYARLFMNKKIKDK